MRFTGHFVNRPLSRQRASQRGAPGRSEHTRGPGQTLGTSTGVFGCDVSRLASPHVPVHPLQYVSHQAPHVTLQSSRLVSLWLPPRDSGCVLDTLGLARPELCRVAADPMLAPRRPMQRTAVALCARHREGLQLDKADVLVRNEGCLRRNKI